MTYEATAEAAPGLLERVVIGVIVACVFTALMLWNLAWSVVGVAYSAILLCILPGASIIGFTAFLIWEMAERKDAFDLRRRLYDGLKELHDLVADCIGTACGFLYETWCDDDVGC